MLDECFLAGNFLDDVIAQNRKLTGKAALLPGWMFGYLQSRERYETEKEIEDTVERFRKTGLGLAGMEGRRKNVPVSGILRDRGQIQNRPDGIGSGRRHADGGTGAQGADATR